MRPSHVASFVLILAVVGARVVHAQSAEAEGMFSEGDRLEAAGQIAQACDAFEASNRVEPRAGTLIRLGGCREKNHQLASAWSAYKDALTRVKDPRKHAIAVARASELEAKLSYLTISVPDESRVDGLEIARNGKLLDPLMWNRAVPIDGGEYTVAGRAPGHEQWQTTITVPNENGKVTVDVPRFKEIQKLITPPSPAGKQGFIDGAPEPRSHKLAYGLGAGGLALGAAAVVLELASRAEVSSAHQTCGADLRCSEPAYSQATSQLAGAALRRDAAIAAGALAAGSVGVAIYLYVRSAGHEPPRMEARLHITPVASEHAVAVFVGGGF